MRVELRVVPRSGRRAVGGTRDGALVVAVAEPAVDGRATEAALGALAEALGVRRRDVGLVSGSHSRRKVVEVAGDGAALAERLAALRGD